MSYFIGMVMRVLFKKIICYYLVYVGEQLASLLFITRRTTGDGVSGKKIIGSKTLAFNQWNTVAMRKVSDELLWIWEQVYDGIEG